MQIDRKITKNTNESKEIQIRCLDSESGIMSHAYFARAYINGRRHNFNSSPMRSTQLPAPTPPAHKRAEIR